MTIFSPSLMCADIAFLTQEIVQLEAAGADRFHLDVMDGVFVPNFALGLSDVKSVCKCSHIPIEVHLMIANPQKYVKLFAEAGADIIYIHPNSSYNPTESIERIKDAGKQPGIVLSPGMSVESALELLYIVDYVVVMGVNPGHAGQVYLPYVDHKVEKLLAIKKQLHFEIMLDGACSEKMIRTWGNRGVDGFVLGMAALFGKKKPYASIISQLRNLVETQKAEVSGCG